MEKIIEGKVNPSYKTKAIIAYAIVLIIWAFAPFIFWTDYDEAGWLIPFAIIIIAFIVTMLYISKCNITVTDKMVTGKAAFGRVVNLPLDSVSAVSTGMLGTVQVATSSGSISFVGILNSDAVAKEISNLLLIRQEKK